jgi:uncharacterized protein (DUF1501 family)
MPVDCRRTPEKCFSHPRITRRVALEAGTIGILGLGLDHLAGLRAMGATSSQSPPRAKSVIYIFLSGGLAQHDSFDPKPDAPDGIRGEFRPIATRTPGIQICEHLPRLAACSDRWALVRSLTHPSNDHSLGHLMMLSGRSESPPGFDPNVPKSSDWPALAAIAGALTRPRNNLPPAVVLPEKLIHRTGRTIPGQFAGQMGPARDPWFVEASPYNAETYGAYPQYLFHHRDGAAANNRLTFKAPNLSLPEGLAGGRMDQRVKLLSLLEQQRRAMERSAEELEFDRYRQQAVSLLAKGTVQRAFDVASADAKLLERYGQNSFGWSCLMAARLVEAGVNLVQVNLGNNETWDTHEAAFYNLKTFLLPPMDRAVSALLDDLDQRGLLESTLVVMAGEFGRTPRIFTIPGAKLPGRDHWGRVQTVFFAGGGVPGGTVVGSSDRIGGAPASDPQLPENMAATIYQALGIPRAAAWHDSVDRPHQVYYGEPISGLL